MHGALKCGLASDRIQMQNAIQEHILRWKDYGVIPASSGTKNHSSLAVADHMPRMGPNLLFGETSVAVRLGLVTAG